MRLLSKLEPPPPMPGSIARPRLFTLLDQWPAYRVVLMRSAAGYGKTSLVGGWLANRPPFRLAWLSLDPDDSDPARFMRYLVSTLERIQPGLLDTVLPILDDAAPDPGKAMNALLIALERAEDVGPAADSTPMLLVLDDFHRVETAQVDELVNLLLERAPANLHFLILTRSLPSLSLARLVLVNALLEVTVDDLRFTPEELVVFMSANFSRRLRPQQLRTLLERTEGWIAGIKLAIISMSRREDAAAMLDPTQAGDQWQAEYLTGEVLNQQSPALRRFLLDIAILDRFDAPLCAAVTGRTDAGILLNEAFSRGLFLVPLDTRNTSFRYHHLFQEVLRERLGRESTIYEIRQLHRRAAAHVAAAVGPGDTEDALQSGDIALRHYLAAGDIDAAAGWLESLVRQAIDTFHYHQADLMLDRLPKRELGNRPSLLLLLCELSARRTEPAIVANTARTEQALQLLPVDHSSRPILETRLSVYQSLTAFHQRQLDLMEHHAGRAENRQYLLSHFERGVMRQMQFEEAIIRASWDRADAYAPKAVSAFIQAGYTPGIILMRQEMAVQLMFMGRLAEAAQRLEQLVNDYSAPQPNFVLRELQYSHLQAAEVNFWMNNLSRLRHHAVQAASLGTELGDEFAVNIASQLLDLYNLMVPDSPELLDLPSRSLEADQAGVFPYNVEFEIIYQVTRGHMQSAQLLAHYLHPHFPAPEELTPSRLVVYTLAWTAAGQELASLDRLMKYGQERLHRDGHLFFLSRLLATEAWRLQQMGDKEQAINLLKSAIILGEQTGMVRHILSIPALLPLLLLVDHPMGRKLAGFMSSGQAYDDAGARINGLSVREREILDELLKDYRYADIAAHLDITLDTTRWYIKRIYRKLGVNSRLAAVKIARAAGLE